MKTGGKSTVEVRKGKKDGEENVFVPKVLQSNP